MSIANNDSICLGNASIAQQLAIHGIALQVLEPAAWHQALPCRPVLQSKKLLNCGGSVRWTREPMPPHRGMVWATIVLYGNAGRIPSLLCVLSPDPTTRQEWSAILHTLCRLMNGKAWDHHTKVTMPTAGIKPRPMLRRQYKQEVGLPPTHIQPASEIEIITSYLHITMPQAHSLLVESTACTWGFSLLMTVTWLPLGANSCRLLARSPTLSSRSTKTKFLGRLRMGSLVWSKGMFSMGLVAGARSTSAL